MKISFLRFPAIPLWIIHKLVSFRYVLLFFIFYILHKDYIDFGVCSSSKIGRFAITLNPCINWWYCSLVISTASHSERGHLKVPMLIRLYSKRKPSPSQTSPLILSGFLPQNRNNVFLS